MTQSWELEVALQGLSDFRRDLGKTPAEKLDLLEQERRVHATHREQMQGYIDYLADNQRAARLAYAQALADNKPIGTGVTEAAAKTAVNTRMKRAGARFDQHGGQTIMLLRTATLSERFGRLSSIIERTYTAKIKRAA